jgi:hypothetical protein
MGEVAEKKITKLGCEKYFCRVTYRAQMGMLVQAQTEFQALYLSDTLLMSSPGRIIMTGQSKTFISLYLPSWRALKDWHFKRAKLFEWYILHR